MKKGILLLAVAVISAAAYVNAATANGTASAEIIAPLTVTSDTNINFGKWITQAGAVSVVLANTGATPSGVTSHLGGQAAGAFTITGQPSTNVTVSIATATLNDGGSNNLSMGTYTFSKLATHALDGSGNSTVNFGATLTGTAHTVGAYTGTYTITVNY